MSLALFLISPSAQQFESLVSEYIRDGFQARVLAASLFAVVGVLGF